MEDKQFTLTETDINAVSLMDSNYINNKGAKFYAQKDFAQAVEYYRLAAAMGNAHAISNLGYCYLYGRSIEQNVPLAMAYFRLAASKNDVDAAYKLGDIYGSSKWGLHDQEMAVYYYRMAASFVIGDKWETDSIAIAMSDELQEYPSLCFALGRELCRGGSLMTDVKSAFQFLCHAETGYKNAIRNGETMYEKSFEAVKELLQDPQFDDIREEAIKYSVNYDDDD